MTARYFSGGNMVRDDSHGDTTSSTSSSVLQWKRVWIIFLPLLLLVLTNPANQAKMATTMQQHSVENHCIDHWRTFAAQELFAYYENTHGISNWTSTNYGLFAMEKQDDRLEIFALNNRWECSYTHPQTGQFCSKLASFMTERPDQWFFPLSSMDRVDRVILATRIISLLLVSSWIFFFCCPTCSVTRQTHPILFSTMSIFLQPKLMDVISANTIVYQALMRMRAALSVIRPGYFLHTGNADFDYYALGVLVLVWLIGNGANALASWIGGYGSQRKPIVGFQSVTAACIMYVAYQVDNSGAGGHLLHVAARFPSLFWVNVFIILMSADKSDWDLRLVNWFVAGLAGRQLAKNHAENIFIVSNIIRAKAWVEQVFY